MGTKYGAFAVGDANIDNVMLQLAGVETGYCALTLTNMTNTAVPQIAAGSKIEVGGSLFKFDAAETITGSATTGTNYIRLVPSGSSITAAWTTTAPTWSDSKQGWYDGTGAYRYAPWVVMYIGGVYPVKKLFCDGRQLKHLGETIAGKFSATALSTSTSSPAQLPITTEVKDTLGEVSGNVVTIKNAGWYKIDVSVTGAVRAGAETVANTRIGIANSTLSTLPGANYIFVTGGVGTGATATWTGSLNALLYAAANETVYFDVECISTSAASVDIQAASWFIITPVER